MSTIPKELFDVALEGNDWNTNILAAIPSCKGVILFADGENRPIQLLQSANLRRTAQARLLRQDAASDRKADLSGIIKSIFYKCCYCDFKTFLDLLGVSQSLGTEISDSIKLPRNSFAAIDLDAALPYFYVSTNPQVDNKRKTWGLFPSRKAAQDFCQSLNIAFCLCRNPSLLESGKEASCPYLQMHQCSGPCVQKVSRANYMDWVKEAVETADGDTSGAAEKLTFFMKQAAQEKKFEHAQILKDRINLLHILEDNSYRWTESLERFCVLHIDKGPKIDIENRKRKKQQFVLWKITAREIYELGLFGSSEEFVRLFESQWETPSADCQRLSPQDRFGILSLMLFRSRPQGLWINASRQTPDHVTLFEKLQSAQAQNKEDAETDPTSS